MIKAKSKLINMRNEQQVMRDTLRSKIEDRMKLSESNLEKIMLSRRSISKSR